MDIITPPVFTEGQFSKLEDILNIIDSNIAELNYKIDYKYGEYAHSYFIHKVENVINSDDLLFEDTVEGLFNELESTNINNIIVEAAQLSQDHLEDKPLQRTIKIKEELNELLNIKLQYDELKKKYKPFVDISDKLDAITSEYQLSNPEQVRTLEKDVHFLKIELEDKEAVMALRSTNYYSNKRMYAQDGKEKLEDISL